LQVLYTTQPAAHLKKLLVMPLICQIVG